MPIYPPAPTRSGRCEIRRCKTCCKSRKFVYVTLTVAPGELQPGTDAGSFLGAAQRWGVRCALRMRLDVFFSYPYCECLSFHRWDWLVFQSQPIRLGLNNYIQSENEGGTFRNTGAQTNAGCAHFFFLLLDFRKLFGFIFLLHFCFPLYAIYLPSYSILRYIVHNTYIISVIGKVDYNNTLQCSLKCFMKYKSEMLSEIQKL